MKLSDFIKDYRVKNKLTSQQLADKCDLSKGYISMLENNFKPRNTHKVITPSIAVIKKIADGTGFDFDFLLRLIDEVSLVDTKDPKPQLEIRTIPKQDPNITKFIEIYNKLSLQERNYLMLIINEYAKGVPINIGGDGEIGE